MRKFRSSQRPWSQPLADLVGASIHPVLARQGFGQSDLILHWDDIVGERLSAMTQPIKLQWPPRSLASDGGFAPATLVVRVESGFALELQHLAGIVVERVNAHLGWQCVGRLSLKQGPIERRGEVKSQRPAPDPAARIRAGELVSDITDPALRDALTRLGAGVFSQYSKDRGQN
ncbi:MAG TPA: DciA family protein [Beijerinckia sp.]|jgi:hypothetical protein|nr:DciA family protein [Beijerinckia sp.]